MKGSIFLPSAVLLFVGLVLTGFTSAYLFLMPKVYQSAVVLHFDKPDEEIEEAMELILSREVLIGVIEKLDLERRWRALGMEDREQVHQRLRKAVDVRRTRDTRVVAVRVSDGNPAEAARIANTVGEVYGGLTATGQSGPGRSGGLQVVEAATVTSRPVEPNRVLGVGGLLVGIGAILAGAVLLLVSSGSRSRTLGASAADT